MQTTTAPPALPPPVTRLGPLGWVRANLCNTWYNTLITLALLAGFGLAAGPLWRWLVWEAHWRAVSSNLRLFLVGLYPAAQLWRPGLLLLLVAFLLGGSAARGGKALRRVAGALGAGLLLLGVAGGETLRLLGLPAAALLVGGFALGRLWHVSALWLLGWVLSLPLALVLLRGVTLVGLTPVPTTQWGGLMLTLLLACIGIVASFPLGLLLALGRQSRLPVVRGFAIVYIEVVRGVPLVSVLMMFALLLPLFLPAGLSRPDMLLRVAVGLTLFTSAYVAENVRGGLQAIPRGQYEAATALGLSWAQSMRYVILPQALRAVIPALVGQFISLFKDTSLAAIVGLLELLGIAKSVLEQPQWKAIPGGVVFEVFTFTALVYFAFTYSMSLASRRLEKALGVGVR